MNDLQIQVKAIEKELTQLRKQSEESNQTEAAAEIRKTIRELVKKYGFRNTANAFGITLKQFAFEFNEYTTDKRYFESDNDLSDAVNLDYVYEAYCRLAPCWPTLITTKTMNQIKEYTDRVRHCHGEFFTLTRKRLMLDWAVYYALYDDEKNFDWWDDSDELFVETEELKMTDAEFEQMQAIVQGRMMKSLILDLIESNNAFSLDAIKAYTLCQTRSVTEEGWGPDVYVLSKDDRAEIIKALANKIGTKATADLFGAFELNTACVDLGVQPSQIDHYEYYYLRVDDDRDNGFSIFGDNCSEIIYRPNVDIEKYLLPESNLREIDPELETDLLICASHTDNDRSDILF